MNDIVDIGAAKRDEATNELLVQAKTAQIGDTPEDAPSLDAAPVFGQLGVAAIPWPADERGNAQGIKSDAPGHNGIITGMRDPRAASVVEEMAPGESALHSTGPDFDARVFCKKQLVATMVGDDCAQVMDRENEVYSISCFGLHIEASERNGIVLTTGGATIQLKGDTIILMGQIILGGRTPTSQVLGAATPNTPVNGTGPGVGIPIPGVFFGV